MHVEMARQRAALNRELEEELQKELEVRGKGGDERGGGGGERRMSERRIGR